MAGLSDVIESSGVVGIISKAAPILGSILLSPMSGVALSFLANAFGVNSKDVKAITQAIENDPESDIKLRQIELQHTQTLAEIASQNYLAEVDDRKSARAREISIRDYVPTILAVGYLLNYAFIQFYCLAHPSSVVDVISARYQDVLIIIMGYYFGSSLKHSKEASHE